MAREVVSELNAKIGTKNFGDLWYQITDMESYKRVSQQIKKIAVEEMQKEVSKELGFPVIVDLEPSYIQFWDKAGNDAHIGEDGIYAHIKALMYFDADDIPNVKFRKDNSIERFDDGSKQGSSDLMRDDKIGIFDQLYAFTFNTFLLDSDQGIHIIEFLTNYTNRPPVEGRDGVPKFTAKKPSRKKTKAVGKIIHTILLENVWMKQPTTADLCEDELYYINQKIEEYNEEEGADPLPEIIAKDITCQWQYDDDYEDGGDIAAVFTIMCGDGFYNSFADWLEAEMQYSRGYGPESIEYVDL